MYTTRKTYVEKVRKELHLIPSMELIVLFNDHKIACLALICYIKRINTKRHIAIHIVKKCSATPYILASTTNAAHLSQKGFCMSTQPLLHESTLDAHEITCTTLQMGEAHGILCQYSSKPGLEHSDFFEQSQSALNTLESVECMPVNQIPLFNELRDEFSEIFSSFIPALKAKDVQLYRHSLRVHSLALSFTTTLLQLPEAESLKIGLAAIFHDIGKMNISDTILLKASGLSRREFEIIKSHPAYGAEMLSPFKLIKRVIPSVYHHHERLDGRGYPDGLRGEAIPLGARIIAIVDAFEVMTSHRIYQKSRTPMQAFEELYEHAGTQFDAELVELFYKFLEIPALNSTKR
jgi:putative nucleotidyltransferase with HDIG domain